MTIVKMTKLVPMDVRRTTPSNVKVGLVRGRTLLIELSVLGCQLSIRPTTDN